MSSKTWILIFCLTIIAVIQIPVQALSDSGSYLYDTNGKSVSAPSSYTASRVVYGEELGIGALSAPSDLYVDEDSNLYIADTGNDRIVVTDSNMKVIQIISQVTENGETQSLSRPKGVFRAKDGSVFICDTGNERVIAIDASNAIVRNMTNKDLVAVNEQYVFSPSKVAVNSDGFVHVIDESVYNGIILYDPEDRFVGYFAPNEVDVTPLVAMMDFWKNIFTEEQTSGLAKALPSAYKNLYIDSENFIFTISVSVGNEVKRLNTLGENILKQYDNKTFGDLELAIIDGEIATNAFTDIHADDQGNFCIAEKTQGKLYLYSKSCQLIAVFGGKGSVSGGFDLLTSIEKMYDSYIALDGGNGTLTVFEPTEYIQDVLKASSLYHEGLYVESVDLWKTVLQQNRNLTVAYTGIGRAYFQEGQYAKGLEMLKKGNDTYFYSLCLKEYRREFARKHFLYIVFGLAMFIALLIFLQKRIRNWILKG